MSSKERVEAIRERYAPALRFPDRTEYGPNGVPVHLSFRQEDLRFLLEQISRFDKLESALSRIAECECFCNEESCRRAVVIARAALRED